jgi:hypothetical protein
LKPISLK